MFRFTIRDLLWLTVVVALGVCWWGERREANQSRRLREENARLAAENGDLALDNVLIGSLIDLQAGSIPRGEKERLFKKYEKASRLIGKWAN
jgi:hypothetical protein